MAIGRNGTAAAQHATRLCTYVRCIYARICVYACVLCIYARTCDASMHVYASMHACCASMHACDASMHVFVCFYARMRRVYACVRCIYARACCASMHVCVCIYARMCVRLCVRAVRVRVWTFQTMQCVCWSISRVNGALVIAPVLCAVVEVVQRAT